MFVGQDFAVPEALKDFVPLMEKEQFTDGDALLMGFAHVNGSLRDLDGEEESCELENVKAAVERGMWNCREWKPNLPFDIAMFIIENSNAYHEGLDLTFIQVIKKQHEVVGPSFQLYITDLHVDQDALPSEGESSLISIYWKWVKQTHSKLYPGGRGGLFEFQDRG